MTATTPKRRVDFTVHPAHITFSTGALLRIAALVLLLGFSSVAVAAAPESTPAASPTPEATPSATMPRLKLDLDELNDSGISGSVTLYEAGDLTIIEFEIKGAGGDHPAHIHAGVCGDLDPEPAFKLDNINKDGKSTTVVKTTLDELLAEDYAVDVHLAPNELGTLIACADIDGQPALPENATPEASPQSTPEPGVGGETTATSARTPTETPTATTSSDGTAGANATGTVATETPAPVTTPAPTNTPQATTPEPTMAGGQGDISDGTGGSGSAVPLPSVSSTTTPGDGTAGVSGKGEPVGTIALPQQTGVGAALAWPDNPVTAMIWASSVAAIVLGTSAWIIRRGEGTTMTTNSRWTRMGI